MVNRRLFRPSFQDVKEQIPTRPAHGPGPVPNKKPAPPETTHAENFYWVKQMQARTPMTIVMADGAGLRGTVELDDRDCIKLTRVGNPKLLIFKQAIKYDYKQGKEADSPNGDHE